MTTATEQLQAIADAWAKNLGGKIPVCINLLVHAGPNHSTPHWGAYIGGVAEERWQAFGATADTAIAESDRKWKLDGAPIDPKDAERAKLRARAAELGMTVIENTQQKENCAHC